MEMSRSELASLMGGLLAAAKRADYYQTGEAPLLLKAFDTLKQMQTDMDARFEHSDHTAAKYYQRMRAAEKESVMRRSESADFEKERDEAVALIGAAEKTIQTAAMHLEGVLQRLDSYSWHQHDLGFVDSTRTPAVDAYNNLTAYMKGENR